MKKNIYFWIVVVMIVFPKILYTATPAEREQARKQILLLREQIKNELDLQKRRQLFKQIAQQREIVADTMTPTQKLLWNAAKVVGGLGLMSWAVYNFFQTSPAQISTEPILPVILPKTEIPSHNISDNKQDGNVPVASFSVQEQPIQQPLTQEQAARYRTVYHQFLPAAVLSSIMGATATLVGIWNPFGMGYLLTSILTGSGAAYSRYKLGAEGVAGPQLSSFQFLRSFLKHPVKLDEINIIPEDMPY